MCTFAYWRFRVASTPAPGNTHVSIPAPAAEPSRPRPKRFVYPYSVIPGGVRDGSELAEEVNRDPVVAAHYAGFSVGSARVVRLKQDVSAHVSYRIGPKVFWTAKKLRIPKGEEVLTDGEQMARTRCGNRISTTPLVPLYTEEPMPASFDVPVIAEVFSPEDTPPGGSSPPPDSPPPWSIVPEPASLVLLASGLAAFAVLRLIRARIRA
jgi:hypothetical protein